MSDFNPKQGEMILAKKHSSDNWDWEAVEFWVKIDGVYHCRVEKEWLLSPFNYAKPSPSKPSPIPFTQETWPKQVVWLRIPERACGECFLVVGRYNLGVIHKGSYYSFKLLMEQEWEISLDHCQTWQPCQYTPTE